VLQEWLNRPTRTGFADEQVIFCHFLRFHTSDLAVSGGKIAGMTLFLARSRHTIPPLRACAQACGLLV
jgi:hypothetical protein